MDETRKETRDLLQDYAMLPRKTAGLEMVYPWEDTNIKQVMFQVYNTFAKAGYEGTQQEFVEKMTKLLKDEWFKKNKGALDNIAVFDENNELVDSGRSINDYFTKDQLGDIFYEFIPAKNFDEFDIAIYSTREVLCQGIEDLDLPEGTRLQGFTCLADLKSEVQYVQADVLGGGICFLTIYDLTSEPYLTHYSSMTQESSLVDKTLTKSGCAADAKVVGDILNDIEALLSEVMYVELRPT